MNCLFALLAFANGEICEDKITCVETLSIYACESGQYYAYGEPYDQDYVHEICPATCAKNNAERSCLEWKYYPEKPPINADDSPDCHEFVSKGHGLKNSDCAKICEATDKCIHQPMDTAGCYGSWMYGYDEEFDFIAD